MKFRIAASIVAAVFGYSSLAARAAETFAERKTLQGTGFVIEYSAGDEAFANALAQRLPLDLAATGQQTATALPVTIESLRERRTEILKAVAEQLALPESTADMGKTYDAFVSTFSLLQSTDLKPAASHFALWRKPELGARLAAGQNVAGFIQTSSGEIDFAVGINFEFREGEAPAKAVEAMRASWSQVTWPLKIEGGAPAAEAEIDQRLAELRQNARELSNFQSVELQRMSVVTVLHETVETTLIREYLHSADRRWFCEGVANYVAHATLEKLAGAAAANFYYDVNAQVAQYASLKDKIDLKNWPVLEDPKSKALPPDVNQASYAFATKAVFQAFGAQPDLLTKVLKDVKKTPTERANINEVYAAYRAHSGRELQGYLK